MLIVEEERAKEPPIDTRRVFSPLVPAHVLPSLQLVRPSSIALEGGMGVETKRRPAVARVSLSGNRSVCRSLLCPRHVSLARPGV